MTRVMYDGVTPSRIPSSATMVAAYVDGHYANVSPMKARFPHARLVTIAVFASTNAGTVLDVEKGDATPTEAPGWVVKRRRAGVDPTVYCSESLWPTVRAVFRALNVPQPHYWIAHYDSVALIPEGAIAKQYKNTSGYDISVVADYWPGVDPKPVAHYEPYPGEHWFTVGRRSSIVSAMHSRLVAVGCDHYETGNNKDTIGTGDIASYEAWQRKYNSEHHKGWTGNSIKWPPGKETWNALHVPNS